MPSGTVDWVAEVAAALPRVPSLAFIHIPLPQFRELWNSQPTRGAKGEAVACPLRDTGVYEAFRQAAEVSNLRLAGPTARQLLMPVGAQL